jgi:uncharacterized protein (TIGR00251 family)
MADEANSPVTGAENGVYVALHIQPGAKREGVAGLFGTSLKIALNAPPVDGKANAALIRFLADRLNVPKKNIEICSGASSRDKRVFISGVTLEKVKELLS